MSRGNLLLLFLCMPMLLFAEKPQFWQTIHQPLGELKEIEFSFRQQYRFQLSRFKTVDARFSLYIKKELTDWLDGEIHLTRIYHRDPNENPFRKVNRLELELNPHFKLCKRLELKFRNRYELIKRENQAKLENKFRQRHGFELSFDGWIKNFSINNEIFYDMTLNKVDEYRFIPCELTFALGKEHTYDLYALVRWRKQPLGWIPQFVLGLTLDW